MGRSASDPEESTMIKFVFLLSVLTLVQAAVWHNSCTDVPNHLRAQGFDDDDCGGWKLEVPVGEMKFKWWHPVNFFYRNDIESISVRAGCTFTGFDDSSLNGGSFTILAGNSDRHVTLADEDEFEDYDEKIQSLSCHCRN